MQQPGKRIQNKGVEESDFVPIVCVECSSLVPQCFDSQQLFCPACLQKVDRFQEVSQTYRLIGLLLLKKNVLRHLLLNRQRDTLEICRIAILHLIAHCAAWLFGLSMTPLAVAGLGCARVDLQYSAPVTQILCYVLYIVIVTELTYRRGHSKQQRQTAKKKGCACYEQIGKEQLGSKPKREKNPLAKRIDNTGEGSVSLQNQALDNTLAPNSRIIEAPCSKTHEIVFTRKFLVIALLYSSFFNYMKIGFGMWRYKDMQYFIIADILASWGNAAALCAIGQESVGVYADVLAARAITTGLMAWVQTETNTGLR